MDCTHVKISSPGGDNAELYRNRKGYFSLNVQTICNPDFKFTDLVARWSGSTHDSLIFNNSNRRAVFEAGRHGDAALLVDAGYACKSYLMPPLDAPRTAEELYNESQIRSTNPVERLFGVWKRRFPVLALGIRLKLEKAYAVIVAAGVLHNIGQDANEVVPPDDPQLNVPLLWAAILHQGEMNERPADFVPRRPNVTRQNLINYFRSLLRR